MKNRRLEATREVVHAVRSALGAEPRIDLPRHPVALLLEDGVLTMEGELADVAAKKLALERAAAIEGVHHIVDRLRVQPARRMGDAEIRDHLHDALLGEPAFQGFSLRACTGRPPFAPAPAPAAASGRRGAVEVSVADGVVTLGGEVPSLCHKRLAGVLAWWVPGARDVVNGIEVVPPEEDSDDEVSDAVHIALEKDPLVDAAEVRVSTRGGTVTLHGLVPSPEQREIAEFDAWYVFGVDRVENRLAVRTLEAGPGRGA